MKAILNLAGKQQEQTFTTKSEAIAWLMKEAGLKRHCVHAYCLEHYGYVNFPGATGWAKMGAPINLVKKNRKKNRKQREVQRQPEKDRYFKYYSQPAERSSVEGRSKTSEFHNSQTAAHEKGTRSSRSKPRSNTYALYPRCKHRGIRINKIDERVTDLVKSHKIIDPMKELQQKDGASIENNDLKKLMTSKFILDARDALSNGSA